MNLGGDSPYSTPATPKRVVFIVGSARSGTSALACTLQSLGLHVPQPEVPPDESNPKGFGESQWMVDFHDRLLNKANVRVADARPQAVFDTARVGALEGPREEAYHWLVSQFSEDVHEVVLKDPRLAWFTTLWRSAALRIGADASYAIMLRPPAEVVGSKQKYYPPSVTEVSRAASWINHMLHTERATRGERRAFVRYSELVEDWTLPIYRLGEHLRLESVNSASARDMRRVHDLIDPTLYRIHTTWEDLDVPKALRILIDETWHCLSDLAQGGEESSAQHAALDQIRREYVRLYEEAEAITQSTTLAASRRRKQGDRAPNGSAATPPPAAEQPPAPRRTPGLLGRRRS